MIKKSTCSGVFSGLFALTAMAGVLLAGAGCSGEHPEPPLERSRLVLRFFRSIRNGDYQSAVRQGGKIHSIDKHNSSVAGMVSVQESNVFIKQAQLALNRGDVEGAASVLADGRRTFPNNSELAVAYSRLRQLRNAEKLINAMLQARRSTSMEAAYSAASIGLSANSSPRLSAYFREYEKEIDRVRKEEEVKKLRTEPVVIPAIHLPAAADKAQVGVETPASAPAAVQK